MIDSRDFRHLMGRFATGIAVAAVSTGEGQAAGITINSFTSVSLNPPLALFCLDKQAHVFGAFTASAQFSVNILAADQEDLSRSFATRQHPQPPQIWDQPRQGCPLLLDTLGWVICRKVATHDAGDHVILVGEVIELAPNDGKTEPLLYFKGGYRRFQ